MSYNPPDVVLIILLGTGLLLLLGMFIAFVTVTYQKKQQTHRKEVSSLVAEYQKEILKAQLEMQEQTFLSISQEIHDNVGQVLSLVRLNISMFQLTDGQDFSNKIASSKELLDQAIEDLRSLSRKLNSRYVEQERLAALLEHQLELIQRSGALHTRFDVMGLEKSLNPEKKLIVFRIAQEALANAIRHAKASTITVHLAFEPSKIRLSICDDGKGFVIPAAVPTTMVTSGTGTFNMRYRAGLIGADLQLLSTPGLGTQVLLTLPL